MYIFKSTNQYPYLWFIQKNVVHFVTKQKCEITFIDLSLYQFRYGLLILSNGGHFGKKGGDEIVNFKCSLLCDRTSDLHKQGLKMFASNSSFQIKCILFPVMRQNGMHDTLNSSYNSEIPLILVCCGKCLV